MKKILIFTLMLFSLLVMPKKVDASNSEVFLCEYNHGAKILKLSRVYQNDATHPVVYKLNYSTDCVTSKSYIRLLSEIVDFDNSNWKFYTMDKKYYFYQSELYNVGKEPVEDNWVNKYEIEVNANINHTLFVCPEAVEIVHYYGDDQPVIQFKNSYDQFNTNSLHLNAYSGFYSDIINKAIKKLNSLTFDRLKQINSIEEEIWGKVANDYKHENEHFLYQFNLFNDMRMNNSKQFLCQFYNDNFESAFNNFKTKMTTQIQNKFNSNSLSQKDREDLEQKISEYEKLFTQYSSCRNEDAEIQQCSIGPGHNDHDKDLFLNNCKDFSKALRIGGIILFMVKIFLPLIIIIKASFNLFSVVTKGDSAELGKQVKKTGFSIMAGIIVFLVPTIINIVFNLIDNYRNNITEDSKICAACVFDPFGSTCKTAITESEEAMN